MLLAERYATCSVVVDCTMYIIVRITAFYLNNWLTDYNLYIAVFQLGWGKGQGAKEIGHNLARERPKFGHNLVRKRHKIDLLRVNDQNLILWAIDENMGTDLQAFYKHFYIGCLKTQKQQLHFVKIKNKIIFF